MIKEEYYKTLYNLVIKSYKKNEIPVGSLVLFNNKIIGKGYNNRQTSKNICGHAEINAIIKAEKVVGDWRLNDCILITTLKPCNMCSEVIKASRIKQVYYLIEQEGVNNLENIVKLKDNNYYTNEIAKIFKDSFKKIR